MRRLLASSLQATNQLFPHDFTIRFFTPVKGRLVSLAEQSPGTFFCLDYFYFTLSK